jgi:Tfp pilus assembly protein PilN
VSQQINLYSPLFRKQKKLFTAGAMLQALAVVALALAGFYGYARLQVTALEKQAGEFEQRVKNGLEKVKALPAAGPKPGEEKALDTRIAELESQLKANEALIAQLAPRESARPGSSAHLEPLRALARRRLEGVWLTSISLEGDSGELSLAGRALDARLVPQYIERLAQDPAMQGRQFSTLTIEREAQGAGGVESVGFKLLASGAARS